MIKIINKKTYDKLTEDLRDYKALYEGCVRQNNQLIEGLKVTSGKFEALFKEWANGGKLEKMEGGLKRTMARELDKQMAEAGAYERKILIDFGKWMFGNLSKETTRTNYYDLDPADVEKQLDDLKKRRNF